MASRGWESATMTDIVRRELDMKRRRAEKPAALPQEGRSKYRAVKTVVDGVTFASKAEARRYVELKALEKSGALCDLALQPPFPLYAWAFGNRERPVRIGHYVADFAYTLPDGEEVIEDVKGMKTPVYRLKKKLVEAQYGIVIREIK